MFWILASSTFFFGYVSCGTEYTLGMTIESPDITEVYLGQKLRLKTTATFAEAATTTGVVIELIPSIQSTIFAICKILSYTKGSKLTTPDTALDTGFFDGLYSLHYGQNYTDTTLKQRFYDRAVFTIGQVVGGTSGGADADYQIMIEYEVVYVSAAGNADGSEQSMGCGMEYDGGNYIWISICTINIKTSAGSGTSETADTTFAVDDGGNADIEVMKPKDIMVTVKSPRSASALTFEVVGMNSSNFDGLSVQKIELTSVGEAYECNTIKENIYVHAYDKCPLSSSLLLDLGRPINTVSKETNPDTNKYALTMKIVLMVDNNDLVGETVGVGFGFDIDGSEVWVYDIGLTVTAAPTPPDVSFVLAKKTGEDVISPGFAGGAKLAVTIPRGTNSFIKIDVTSKASVAASNALSILSINPIAHGNNIPCSIPSSAIKIERTETASTPGLFESASLSVNVSNTNMQQNSTTESDIYDFEVYVMMMPSATEAETFDLDVRVNDQDAQRVVFTAGGPAEYPENVNYTYAIDCGNTLKLSGSVLSYVVTIDTTPGVTAGNMTIETPIPVNVSNSNLEFVSATVTNKGTNPVCLPHGLLKADLSEWETGSGLNDRAVIFIPLMCNVEIDTTSEDANKVEIEVKVKMVDSAEMNAADRTDLDEFGFGVKIGNKIWVASCGYNTKAPFDDLKRYNGVVIEDGSEPQPFPSDFKIQWSPDNVKFYTHNHTFGSGVPDTSSTTYSIDPPLYARYVRLINSDGGNSTSYSFDSAEFGDDIVFQGSESSKIIMMSQVQMLLDDDVTTCLSLPTTAVNETATYYWANFKTSVFRVDDTAAFNLKLTGKGLQCHKLSGPQVTLVMHPKNSETLKFLGRRKKCKVIEDVAGPPTTCTYECACSDAVTCADVSLVLYYDGTPASDFEYELCDVTATQ